MGLFKGTFFATYFMRWEGRKAVKRVIVARIYDHVGELGFGAGVFQGFWGAVTDFVLRGVECPDFSKKILRSDSGSVLAESFQPELDSKFSGRPLLKNFHRIRDRDCKPDADQPNPDFNFSTGA